jgi:hypothetical protein
MQEGSLFHKVNILEIFKSQNFLSPIHNSEKYEASVFQYHSIRSWFYSNSTQSRPKWILISLNISAVIYIYTFFQSITFQYFSHLRKFLYPMSLTVHNKWRHYTEDVNRLEVIPHAHYVTGENVTPHTTYKYLQSVRCGTESQNTKHDLHTATVFVSRLCGSSRILLAGFLVL